MLAITILDTFTMYITCRATHNFQMSRLYRSHCELQPSPIISECVSLKDLTDLCAAIYHLYEDMRYTAPIISKQGTTLASHCSGSAWCYENTAACLVLGHHDTTRTSLTPAATDGGAPLESQPVCQLASDPRLSRPSSAHVSCICRPSARQLLLPQFSVHFCELDVRVTIRDDAIASLCSALGKSYRNARAMGHESLPLFTSLSRAKRYWTARRMFLYVAFLRDLVPRLPILSAASPFVQGT